MLPGAPANAITMEFWKRFQKPGVPAPSAAECEAAAAVRGGWGALRQAKPPAFVKADSGPYLTEEPGPEFFFGKGGGVAPPEKPRPPERPRPPAPVLG